MSDPVLERIDTIEDFLLWLPLFRQEDLADFLARTVGVTRPAYLYIKLEDLCRTVEDSDAKAFVIHHQFYHHASPTMEEIDARESSLSRAEIAKMTQYQNYIKSDAFRTEHDAYHQLLSTKYR